jgi:hypothetical protein
MSVQARNFESARNYLRAIESGVKGETLGAFFAPWSGICSISECASAEGRPA